MKAPAIDAAAHEATMAAVALGEQDMLTAEETPPRWPRRRRSPSGAPSAASLEKEPSVAVGVSQSYVADLESGRREGDAALVKRLARALRLRMEDLVADEARE